MWYHSALTLMLVEVTARSTLQIGLVIVIYIINAIFNAILFGIYFDLLAQARERQNNFQTQLDNANTAMTNLSLPEPIKEQVRNYILQTHETKTQQAEFRQFEETMPPSMQKRINALNFKKALKLSPNMIILRLNMRDLFRQRRRNLTERDLHDPNRVRPDPNEGEKQFRMLMRTICDELEVIHVQPEEIVIMQNDPILNQNEDYIDWYEDKAKFYVILNGHFNVSSLRFNKRKKHDKY